MKTKYELPFCKKHLHLQGKSPFVRMSPSMYQEEKDGSKSLETLISGEGRDLNLHNNLTFLYWDFSWSPPATGHPQPPMFFICLWLKMAFKLVTWVGHFGELFSFVGYLSCIQEVSMLLNSHLYIYFFMIGGIYLSFYYRECLRLVPGRVVWNLFSQTLKSEPKTLQ